MRNLYFNEKYFDEIDSKEKAYWLGFILGDGHIRHQFNNIPNSLIVELKIDDLEYLKLLSTALKYTGKIKGVVRKPDNRTGKIYSSCILCLHSVKMCQALYNKGWLSFKNSGDIGILENISSKFLPSLLRGLMDADGCVYINKKNQAYFSFIDLHYSVVEWYQNKLLENLNIIQTPIRKPNKAYRLSHEGNIKVSKILDFIYSDSEPGIFMPRKRVIYEKISKTSNSYRAGNV